MYNVSLIVGSYRECVTYCADLATGHHYLILANGVWVEGKNILKLEREKMSAKGDAGR